jgi:hypothetical protein
MENIWKYDNLDFSKIKLKMPKPLQGGTYFSKIEHTGNPVLIQTPKCLTKNGIHKTGKKIYVDLKFSLDDKEIIDWISEFEKNIKLLIFDKKDIWFHDEPTEDEIDYLWSDAIRNNKDSYLLRTFVQRTKNADQIQIWDEDESELTLDEVKNTDKMISIIEFSGLKFTSQSFCLELYLRQIVVIKDKPIFNKCLITLNKNNARKVNLQLDTKNKEAEDVEVEADVEAGEVEKKDVEEVDKEEEEQEEEVEEVELKKNNEETQESTNIEKEEDEEEAEEEEEEKEEENIVENSEKITNVKIEDDDSEKNIELYDSNNEIKNDVLKDINKKKDNTLVKKGKLLEEFDLKVPETAESISLKTPRDVYLEIYKKARKKALDAKKEAIKAFLEAKNIKDTYLIDQYDNDSEEEEFMEFIETGDSSE